ncbi:DUF4221 domain-containing protein [Chitinophaga pinensis]|nr:DUF4221 domain-containing protein [Chitinophaga pinensis]
MTKSYAILFLFGFVCICGCSEHEDTNNSEYVSIQPQYDKISLQPTSDTIHLALDDKSFSTIRSVNSFQQDSVVYLAIHDKRLENINIYEALTGKKVKRIKLKRYLDDQIYKPSSFTKNFDSIYVSNYQSLTLLDSSGKVKAKYDFVDDPPLSWSLIGNDNPVYSKDNKLYTAVRNNVNEKSLKKIQKWKLFYEYDLSTGKAELRYNFPDKFRHSIHGYRFLNSSYCYNDSGRFVISFAGDSLVYETDFKGYHKSYYAKSVSQTTVLPEIKADEFSDEKAFENFLFTDAYSSIFYDNSKKYYLRIFRQKITKAEYQSKQWSVKQSVIIMDQNHAIIGEGAVDPNIWLESIFFMPDGNIYARVNSKDEYALHFVRLEYVSIN